MWRDGRGAGRRTLCDMSTTRYEGLDPGRDLGAVLRLLNHAFATPTDAGERWIGSMGVEHVRVLRTARGVEACLVRIPMGQYFGGRSVPMLGVAGVAVAPESRGRGLAREIMRELVAEGAREGTAISTLYPSTQALYRQVGYEAAGHRHQVRIAATHIGVRERGGEVVALGGGHEGDVRAGYARFAAKFDGMLDRGEYAWSRVRDFRGTLYTGFGVVGEGGLAGYVYLHQRRNPETMRQDLLVSDFVFDGAWAGRRLWGFLADFATVADEVRFFGGAWHPALHLLDQQRQRVEFGNYWMTRVLDAPAAFAARGYAPGLDAEIQLEINDDLVDANTGRWVLRVRDGRGTLERGGRGEVRLGPRGLAACFSGLVSGPALEACGLAEGDGARLALLGGMLATGSPWMVDFF